MNILYKFENELPAVFGTHENKLDMSIVEEQLTMWQGKTETDPSVYPQLKKYWDYVKFGDGWTPTGTAWSSAFISYVLQNEEFPKRSAHYQYIEDIMNGKYPSWSAFSIPKSNNLSLEIGNVLVRPRSSSDTATHGDVVYKIEKGLAYLVGGNMSNTAKIVEIIEVDQNNRPKKPIEDYIIILKKKRKFSPMLIAGMVGLTGLLFFMVKK